VATNEAEKDKAEARADPQGVRGEEVGEARSQMEQQVEREGHREELNYFPSGH